MREGEQSEQLVRLIHTINRTKVNRNRVTDTSIDTNVDTDVYQPIAFPFVSFVVSLALLFALRCFRILNKYI